MAVWLCLGYLSDDPLCACALLVFQTQRLALICLSANNKNATVSDRCGVFVGELLALELLPGLLFNPLPAQGLAKIVEDNFFAWAHFFRFLHQLRLFARLDSCNDIG